MSFEAGVVALISGDWIGGEGLEERALAPFSLPETLPDACAFRSTRTS